MPDNTREEALFRAQMAEQAERYDEMVEAAKQLVSLVGATGELTADERSVLSVAFKNFTGTRRASWRILSGMETREESKMDNGTSKKLDQIKKLRQEVENEMRKSCGDIVQMLDRFLIPQAAAGESKVFYHKMKGDYYRYLAEFNSSDKKQISENALQAYKEANEVANRELAPTHPIRLGLGLNFSVFYYEIMGSPERACRLAKTAFDDAIAELDNLNEDSYKDSSLIMQLLRDNLTLWSSDISDEKEVNGLVDGEN